MWRIVKKYSSIPFLFVLVAASVLLPRAFFLLRTPHAGQGVEEAADATLLPYINSILTSCDAVGYRPTCYDEEIPKLMQELTMEQAFEVTREVQAKDKTYTYCHVLGHKLSAIETAKDPSKWKDVVTRAPHGLCSNGAIHGAFQERFRKEFLTDDEIEELKPELADVCEARGTWNPAAIEQASCYHALGHLTMYITSGEIDRATTLCNSLALKGKRDYRKLCYDGSFMQIFQPLEPDDFALVKGKAPTKAGLAQYCKKFAADLRAPCWNEGWPLYRAEITTPVGLDTYCGSQFLTVREDVTRCYSAMVYVVTAQFTLDSIRMEQFCAGLKEQSRQAQCLADAAGRMIETDYRNASKALGLCQRAVSDLQDACFSELVKSAGYTFPKNSPAAKELCASMPQYWQAQCQNRIVVAE